MTRMAPDRWREIGRIANQFVRLRQGGTVLTPLENLVLELVDEVGLLIHAPMYAIGPRDTVRSDAEWCRQMAERYRETVRERSSAIHRGVVDTEISRLDAYADRYARIADALDQYHKSTTGRQ